MESIERATEGTSGARKRRGRAVAGHSVAMRCKMGLWSNITSLFSQGWPAQQESRPRFPIPPFVLGGYGGMGSLCRLVTNARFAARRSDTRIK